MYTEIPKYDFTFAPEAKEIKLSSFKSGKWQNHSTRFYWNFNSYAGALFKSTPVRLADLAEIAGSIFLADRLALRPPREWKRNLRLTIPVRDLSFWNQTEMSELLSDILYYLTEDDWTFQFTARESKSFENCNQVNIPFDMPAETFVALFSGGLDSFAGVANHLRKCRFRKSFLVSVVTNYRMRGRMSYI